MPTGDKVFVFSVGMIWSESSLFEKAVEECRGSVFTILKIFSHYRIADLEGTRMIWSEYSLFENSSRGI